MMELHDRFEDWLEEGAEGDPPRDLALHASSCQDCLRAVAAVESLQAIDVGAAPLPPLSKLVESSRRPFDVARLAVGSLAVVVLAVSVAIGTSGLLRPDEPGDVATAPRATAEGVLYGAPRTADPTSTPRSEEPSPTESPTPTPTPTATRTPSPAASPAPIPAPVQPAPPTPRPPTPAPTAAPTAAPSTPAPTAAPTTPPPTPTPTLEPTPTPMPQCSDGADNDGDLLIDFPVDLGCTSPEDDDEGELPLP